MLESVTSICRDSVTREAEEGLGLRSGSMGRPRLSGSSGWRTVVDAAWADRPYWRAQVIDRQQRPVPEDPTASQPPPSMGRHRHVGSTSIGSARGRHRRGDPRRKLSVVILVMTAAVVA